jgi:hypothetical protein
MTALFSLDKHAHSKRQERGEYESLTITRDYCNTLLVDPGIGGPGGRTLQVQLMHVNFCVSFTACYCLHVCNSWHIDWGF